MPALGSPLVRAFRRRAEAHLGWTGHPEADPGELLAAHVDRLTRRELLGRGAAVGAVSVAAGLGLGRMSTAKEGRQAKVVVVGGGLAGLACTYRLRRRGIAATLYEAQERLGGRCWSIRDLFVNGQTAEHGGQYVDSRHHQIRALARELGVGLVDTYAQSFPAGDASYRWFDGALREPEVLFAGFPAFLDALKLDATRIGPIEFDKARPAAIAYDRMSMLEWFEERLDGGADSLLGRALGTFMQSFWGMEPADISAIALIATFILPTPGADERFRIAGGNDSIVRALVDALPASTVRTGHPLVAGWTRSDGRAGLRFDALPGDVVADRVVLALPFTVLRDLDIGGLELSPRKRRAINALAMGTNSKLNMQFDRSFAELGWDGGFSSDEPMYVTWDSTYGQSAPAPETPVLTIYTGGDEGASYPTDVAHGVPSPEIMDATLAALARGVDGIEAAWNGVAWLDSWIDDPWVHGSYAGFAPGQFTDFWGSLGRREGRVHFAGEHTSTHSQGYLNGGVESGERAAREVINALSAR